MKTAQQCGQCGELVPWIWTPPVVVGSRLLPGTGRWLNPLIDDACPHCRDQTAALNADSIRQRCIREHLIAVMGSKAYREFTFERFRTTPGNQAAFDAAQCFRPGKDGLYLWGPCGVGKTHLAWAAFRRAAENMRPAICLTPPQLSRRLRLREPDEERASLQELVRAEVLVIDDLGMGQETPFLKQVLQEILDQRNYQDRGGLLVTSKLSLDDLAGKLADDTIPSRLAGMCRRVRTEGSDLRMA